MSPVPLNWVDRSLAEFCEGLSVRTRVPSAGCLAAFQTASGAALASMAFRRATGESGAGPDSEPGDEARSEAQPDPYMEGRAVELEELRSQALHLLDRDAEALAAVLAAGSAATAGRPALEQALEIPFEIMETALAALRLAAVGAPEADAEVRPDCVAAAATLWSGLEGAGALVHAGARELAARDDQGADELAAMRAEAEAMQAEAAALLEEVRIAAGEGLG